MDKRELNKKLDHSINEYRMTHPAAFPMKTAEAPGLVIQYPSADQLTIAQGRDFYVIGAVTMPLTDDATMRVTVTQVSTNKVVREISCQKKNDLEGMYVDYDKIVITGDKEEFRKAGMPDLVYDPRYLPSFYYTWNKCFFNDSIFTCLVYGGEYRDDVLNTDQNGEVLLPLELGEYEINVTVGEYNVTQKIHIGDIPEKILARFHPLDHRAKVEAEAEKTGYTMFLDPFPGYWDTMMFNPEWGVDFIADNSKRWKYNDGLEYKGGRIHFYIYDTGATSTSYSVELGVIQEAKDIENRDRLVTNFYDIGEPVNAVDGKDGQFVCADDFAEMKGTPLRFLRVDLNSRYDGEYTDKGTPNFTPWYDLKKVPRPTDNNFSVYGCCLMPQLNTITRNNDSTYTYNLPIDRVEYFWEIDGERYAAASKQIGLTRDMNNGANNKSMLEFMHRFSLLFYNSLLDKAQSAKLVSKVYYTDNHATSESEGWHTVLELDLNSFI